jgi:hypothetical protein
MLVGICITPPSLKRYVMEPNVFLGYLERGSAVWPDEGIVL